MTQRQRILFFRLFQKACEVRGIPPAEREAYRHRLIAHACPISGGSLRNVGAGEDFDRLMRLVAREAQSVEAAGHFATAEARRVAKLCEALVWQIWQIDCGLPETLKGKSAAVEEAKKAEKVHERGPCQRGASAAITPADYLRAVIAQAGWRWAVVAADDGWWLDLPLPHAQKLMMMLDTHRRRLLKRAPRAFERLPDGSERRMRRAFDPNSVYRWVGQDLWRLPIETAPAPRVRVRVTA